MCLSHPVLVCSPPDSFSERLLHSDNQNHMIKAEKTSAQLDISILANLSQELQAAIRVWCLNGPDPFLSGELWGHEQAADL